MGASPLKFDYAAPKLLRYLTRPSWRSGGITRSPVKSRMPHLEELNLSLRAKRVALADFCRSRFC